MGLQSCGSPNFGNSRTPTWGPWTKWHLGASCVARHRKYYKGEGGGFPQVRAMVFLWVCVCASFVHAPKVLQLCTNQLVIGLCRSMWIIDLLVTCFSPHPGALACPSTLEVLWARECIPTPYPFIVFILDM